MNSRESKALDILEAGLSAFGIAPTDDRMDHFSRYLGELKKWNRAYNLTGMSDDRDIVIKHFLDSLLYLSPLPTGFFRAADVGSGGGFPGIPIKIVCPETEMHLIEPSSKKSAFLRHMVRHLRMEGIEVIEKRVEDVTVPGDLRERVDAALTRALFDIRTFVKKTARIVRPGGLFILNKGPRVKEELTRAGDVQYRVFRSPLPQTDIVRYIVVVKAEGDVEN